MFRPAILRSLITGLGIAVIATACTPENIAGPQASLTTPSAATATSAITAPTPNASLLGGLIQTVTTVVSDILYPVVQRQTALAHPVTVTQVIPVTGGTISIPAAGMTITFARGALLTATPITVTADSGRAISYEFGPHGTLFYAPVTIAQDMSVTTLVNNTSAASTIQGGYTPDGLLDIVNGLLAKVSELLTATTTVVIGSDGTAHLGTSSFIIKHFSGYILISG